MVEGGDWHYYLAVKGVLQRLANLIEAEINYFGYLEKTRLSSDLALGFAVKELTGCRTSIISFSCQTRVYRKLERVGSEPICTLISP